MFQKYVHALPQGVIKDLNHFLMNERVRSECFDRIGAFNSGKREGQGISGMGELESGADLIVALRRSESHHDIFRMKNRFQPGPEKDGKIQCGKRAFPNDYRMNKFDRNMLSVGRVGTASECKQTTPCEEALGHGPASFRQAKGFPRKKFLDDTVPREQALFHLSRQPTYCGHGTTLKNLNKCAGGDRRPAYPQSCCHRNAW